MIILGLDPGLATTGYAIVSKNRRALEALEWGTINTQAHTPLPRRLTTIANDLQVVLKRFRPELGVVESVFFAANRKTALEVAQARGVILLVLCSKNIKIVELTPLQLKQRMTSYGKASKQQMQAMVQKVYKLKQVPRPDDAADALALAASAAA